MSSHADCHGDPVCEKLLVEVQLTEEYITEYHTSVDEYDDVPAFYAYGVSPVYTVWFKEKLASRRERDYPAGACFYAGQYRKWDVLRKLHSEGPMPRRCFSEFMKGLHAQ